MTHRLYWSSALALLISTLWAAGPGSSTCRAQSTNPGIRFNAPGEVAAPGSAPARRPTAGTAPIAATGPAVQGPTLPTAAGARVGPGMAGQPGIMFNVQASSQRLDMIVNTSRILTLDQKIPTAQVGNRDLLDLTALSPTQIQVHAKKAGVTQINLWNEANEIRTVDVIVYPDSRELQLILESQFPRASLTVTPLANSVIVGGFVDRSDQVNKIIRIAEDYHPNIINNITVGGVQQVLLDVKVLEVSRTRLRTLGFDWAHFSGNDLSVSSVSGLITAFSQNPVLPGTSAARTFTFGVVNPNSSFFGVLEFLARNDVAKVTADPKLVTVSGRPARFLAGGEFPVLVPQSLGTVSIEYRPYGTELDFVPIVMGNGLIRLELRPRVSEPDPSLSVQINGTTVPALTIREADTGVELRAGQTLAIAGLVQSRVTTQKTGVPWIMDVPYLGALFSRKTARENEVETLFLVTPHLVDAMDCHEVPTCLPGSHTTVPNDWELYLKNYVEVPRCCPPMEVQGGPHHGPGFSGPVYEGPVQGGPMQGTPPRAEEVQPRLAPPGGQPAPPQAAPPSSVRMSPPRQSPSASVRPTAPVAPASQPRAMQPAPATAQRNAPAVAATSSASASRSNRYDANNPPEPTAGRRPNVANTTPGFIGPVGYDVQ